MTNEDDTMQFEVQIVVRPMASASGDEPAGSNITVTAKSPNRSVSRNRASSLNRATPRDLVSLEKAKPPSSLALRNSTKQQLAIQGTAIRSPTTQNNMLSPGWPLPEDIIRPKSPVVQGRRSSDSYITNMKQNESRRVRNRETVRPQKFNGGVNISPKSGQHEASEVQVSAYLKSHPDFLEQWLMEEVDLEQLERWMIRKMQRDKKKQPADANGKVGRKTSLSRWKFCVHADKRQMLQELTHSLQTKPDRSNVLWELASCICSAVSADGFRLYLAEPNPSGVENIRGSELMGQYLGHDIRSESGEPLLIPISSPTTVPEFVARSREPLRLSKGSGDQRFPVPSPRSEGKDNSVLEAEHALWQPIVQADSEMTGVLLMWRRQGPAFHEEDEEIARSYLVWGGIALHYAQLFLSIDKTRRLNDFLLKVVKSIFQDMVSMDALVVKVMTYAQRLVDADRASLFLVDSRSKELYARIFDMGTDDSKDSEENSSTRGKEIRFPLGTGIAGQVALTGEVLNITDAYSDPRFNRTVDQLTGYHTRTILCMPIFIRGITIGVVQMVNKRCGLFTKEDEEAFETFAVYCGLALHHAKLYEKIQRSEQKYRVALDVLSYHNTCSEDEVLMMKSMTEINPEGPTRDSTNKAVLPVDSVGSPSIDVASYYFNIYALDDMKKVRYAVSMFSELFGMSRFDQDNIIRFTLTVRKNYRRVPYHNWAHGFSVANSMYSIIKHSREIFKPNECLALYIGSLCHDLDHRGKNNKFMLDTESPLASIYSTSTMEHHHFNQTITILQQEGHNIFSKLSSEEYKQVLSNIKHCILATDLALFFPNKARLTKIVEDGLFSWTNPEHRLLLEAITMTASDLSASAKPWELQVKTVKVIFEEFYEQGDAEKAAGRIPIPMMDRDQPDQQAASQVGFINGICIPCYSLLYKLLPETKPLLDQCKANLARWERLNEEQKKLRESKAAAS
ncbi:probable 3',5'-cyclic phosphodiesterase pde-5 isoform X1 [Neocloeon triangulifer]|uniref:probable 3',5'-cyclic phosphodiesterase pde-5 isoform X1 n=1 Tax=Neocloeon triangulifer TaxID=2078957 RepID=UPI00286F404B|nr:probable 3',5'-cyclic phosphodiesterase pde-5 isoform X1 [Neocloeon triangulifer]